MKAAEGKLEEADIAAQLVQIADLEKKLKEDSSRLSKEETDIIKALFPGGSITGAPKEQSMKIIDLLENYQRGIYTGALGSIFSNGDMDFNICIRTMTVKDGIGNYPVGGGIVWDSDPLEEWQEAQQKSKIFTPFKSDTDIHHSQIETCTTTY